MLTVKPVIGCWEPGGVSVSVRYVPSCANTGSLYLTVRLFEPVTAADTMRGAWPSATGCWNAVSGPSGLPESSTSAVRFTVSVPVALPATSSVPLIVITWESELAMPACPLVARKTSGSSSSAPYAAGTRLTGSLYLMTISSPSVMRADTTRGAMPSATSTKAVMG